MARAMTSSETHGFLLHGTRTAKVATIMPDGTPHVAPVWFVLDGEQVVFTTGADSAKGRNLRRDPRVSLVIDNEEAPYAFVHLRGVAAISSTPRRAAALRD